MILFSAALPVVYGGPLLVLPLEQRQVAGRVPRSEQRSEGQREYLAESQRHLRRHRAPITATRPMDIFLATGIRVTVIPPINIHLLRSPAMDIQAIPVLPLIRVHEPTGTRAMQDTPITQVRRAMNTTATRGTPPIPVPGGMDHLATWDTRLTPARRATKTTATRDRLLSPVPRTTDIRVTRSILPRPVPILDTLSIAIPAIKLPKDWFPGEGMASIPLAEPVPPRTLSGGG